MKYCLYILSILSGYNLSAQPPPSPVPPSPAVRLAATAMATWKDSAAVAGQPGTAELNPARWTYEEAVVWLGLVRLWYNTGDARYFKYVRNQVDRLVDKDGNILTYKLEDYSLDNILCGRLLLLLYETTGQEKYYKAATRLRQQLKGQPRTTEGSFWHKKKYTQQVWLDGLYMAQPFYAQYAALFHEDSPFDDITRQFVAIEGHTRDPKTGLLYQGRAMGWYGMGLVDALEYFPSGYAGRKYLLTILQRYAAAIQKVQDPATGLWWDIPDKPGQAGNYAEASATAMFVYTLARGVRLGYLPAAYLAVAQRGYRGLADTFIGTDSAGATVLRGTVSVNDQKGVGAFLLAAIEMDMLSTSGAGPASSPGKGQTVLLDYYFNNEHRKDITGASVRYHYTWEDRANSGFSLLGHLFRQYGAHTDSLPVAPSANNLKRAAVYIIVDPDDEREVAAPNYPGPAELKSIYDWVENGGSLVLLSNDSANAEFTHFNMLAGKFGIHFNYDDYHKVTGNNYEMGAFTMTGHDAPADEGGSIFKSTHKIYIKELSTLQLSPPATAAFTDSGHVIMAISRVGKGRVFAVGDPWFYNEYTDGRKLPADYENYNAARDLVQWLLQQSY